MSLMLAAKYQLGPRKRQPSINDSMEHSLVKLWRWDKSPTSISCISYNRLHDLHAGILLRCQSPQLSLDHLRSTTCSCPLRHRFIQLPRCGNMLARIDLHRGDNPAAESVGPWPVAYSRSTIQRWDYATCRYRPNQAQYVCFWI